MHRHNYLHHTLHKNMIQRMTSLTSICSVIIAITVAVTVSCTSITSPDVCLSNLECPSSSFCNQTQFSQLPLCAPRLPSNAVCNNVGLGECEQSLTCIFDDSVTRQGPLCRPRSPRGAACRLDATHPCVDSLVCDRKTTTCQPFTDGFSGTPCEFDGHCQQDKGFYCQSGPERPGGPPPRVCAPKRGPGGECNRRADNFECLGFCVSQSFNDGICVSARTEAELCTEVFRCENGFFDRSEPGADRLMCNKPRGSIGRCVRESRLIRTLGTRCDPDHDRCDARRSLSCHPTRDGDHVCQHRVSRFDRQFEFSEHCEPQSRLSRCAWGSEKSECRLERAVPGQSAPFGPGPFFVCRRNSENVARGGVCITEYAACVNGTECREVPGVEPEPAGQFVRFPPPKVAFCVHIAQRGESCGDVKDKFTTQCGEGLHCEKGICAKATSGEDPFDNAVTHAGLRALCSDLPCAPGLVCEKDEFGPGKVCVLPLRTVGKGRACTDRAVERRRCKTGLACVLRKDGTNMNRCREIRQAGDYCQDDGDCADGLVCPVNWTNNREQEERRCYDPKTTLKIGDTCNPEASPSQARCVVYQRPDPDFPSDTVPEPMRCMQKGDGFSCRAVRSLFEFCDEARDITCDTSMKCGSLGICVPVEEN